MAKQSMAQLKARYWVRVRVLTLVLLALWLAVTVVGPWFARDLNRWSFLGFPLSFWLTSQGALFTYVLIILGYALAMERIDAHYRAETSASDAKPDPPSTKT